jgi:hypothetical protein
MCKFVYIIVQRPKFAIIFDRSTLTAKWEAEASRETTRVRLGEDPLSHDAANPKQD